MPKVTVKLQAESLPKPDGESGGAPENGKASKEGKTPGAKKGAKVKGSFTVPLVESTGDVAIQVGRPKTPRKYAPEHIERIVLAIALACVTSGASVRHDLEIDLPGLQNPSLHGAVLRCMKAAVKPPKSRY